MTTPIIIVTRPVMAIDNFFVTKNSEPKIMPSRNLAGIAIASAPGNVYRHGVLRLSPLC